MMEKIIILVALLLILPYKADAEDTAVSDQRIMSNPGYPDISNQAGSFDSDCDNECQPHQTMKNLVEGRVANVACLQACKQRKVWEKLSNSIADVADSLKKNSYKEVLVPMEMKLDDLRAKVDSLEKKLDKIKPGEKEVLLNK
jgi:hypothetical protein